MHGVTVLWIGLGAVGAARLLPAARRREGSTRPRSTPKVRRQEGAQAARTTACGSRSRPGEAETGWKTPQALRIGGDFTITANLVIRKLPKPAQEDGAAIGLAVATQNVDQPDATLIRLIEPDGTDVYRPIEQGADDPSRCRCSR